MITQACEVYFDGILVGTLAYTDADSRIATFEYDRDWLSGGFALDPIHLPLTPALYQFPHLSWDTYKGLPAALADSLPDDFGNALIDAWLARQGLDKAQFMPLDRLLYTGTRGMGALEYRPATKVSEPGDESLLLSDLVEMAQKVLDKRNGVELDLHDSDALTQLLQVGTSAGGARPKAVVAINDDYSQIRSGQVPAPEGFEHYLLKFDGVVEKRADQQTYGDPQGYGAMEFVYSQLADKCRIKMAKCDLLKEPGSGRAHFITRRFDRVGGQKYHLLSLCALAHADYKKPGAYSYEELLGLCRQLGLSYPEQEQIYRRMVFNVVARNQDDHTKNFALMVDDNFEWVLAPAYDLAYSYRADSDWVSQHQMSLAGKRDHFTRADLVSVASQIGPMSTADANAIIDQVIDVVSNWREMADSAGVPAVLRDEVWSNLRLNL
ncbi:type II toxin-antitoxin system HipA family toxin [Aliagarivorans taiwanensis]|uniref:type II toxin-antitoxin system HipA family toxin n=1 Tax=Aliagarivorans taiwanensis TaxID=561966 RepID=UPI0003FAC41C|nr:type II toxin-antitoxin system HipA family toxin [Aliagarivorans taiwanensis]